jgi:sugar lactone lactonase YvrE
MTAMAQPVRFRDTRDDLGEGLLWSARDTAIYWTDIIGKRLWRLSLADNAVTHWDMPEMIGWIIERASGGFVVGLQSGFYRLSLEPFALELIANPHPERPGNRLNDAKADAWGRIWAGSMPVADGPPSTWPPTGALYRLDADGAVSLHDDKLTIANGPAFSPDGCTLYHTDSARGTVYRFALGADGTLGPRAVHLVFPPDAGAPDGMACDADGGLWIAFYHHDPAHHSRVARFLPSGAIDREIRVPTAHVTNLVFAGPNLDRMFITSARGDSDNPNAGALFEADPGCRGMLPQRFAG